MTPTYVPAFHIPFPQEGVYLPAAFFTYKNNCDSLLDLIKLCAFMLTNPYAHREPPLFVEFCRDFARWKRGAA